MTDIEKQIDEIHAQQAELRAAECGEPAPVHKALPWSRMTTAAVMLLVVGTVWMGLLHQGPDAEDESMVVAQHQASPMVSQPASSDPVGALLPARNNPKALSKHPKVPSAAATAETPEPDTVPTPDQEPLLLFNSEADGLCLANNVELDCDDISRIISDLLL